MAFAAVGLIAGTGLLTAGFAMAANTLETGNLTLTPGSGPVSTQPTWATTDGCPSGFQGSAVLAEFNTDGSFASNVSAVVNSPAAAFNGTLEGTISSELSATNVTNGGTIAFAVGCFSQSGGTGSVEYVQLTFVQLSSDGTTYATTDAGPTPTSAPSPTATSTSSDPNNAAAATTSPTSTASATASATPTDTTTASASPTSTLPSGGAQTGYGGAALPGGPSNLLIALGAIALAGSAAAMGLAVRRSRKPTGENGAGDGTPGAN